MTRPVRRALLSVSDKSGLEPLARGLVELGVEIVSTGGTAAALKAAGMVVRDVSELTGFPEILDGRVKTLHPAVHAGLLSRRDDAGHIAAMERHGLPYIDLLVVNLYPFEQTVAAGAAFAEAIEKIDVGGPAMIRAAAKNHEDVVVIVDPADYGSTIDELKANAAVASLDTRRRLAAKAFARVAAYDAAIARYLAADTVAPDAFAVAGRRIAVLRYGENPHQQAAFYAGGPTASGIAGARQVQGKELSYNNIVDADAAWSCAADLGDEQAVCVIVKHANPCGAARAATLLDAYRRALACDPVSAFGGIVALNRRLDEDTAREIVKLFTEVIVVPSLTDAARAIIAAKPNLRLLIAESGASRAEGLQVKSVSGGFLVQTGDHVVLRDDDLRCVTARRPTAGELADLKFAFAVAKHVKSNAIVFARQGSTRGIGAGQMSRLDSVRIAVAKAADTFKDGEGGKPLAGSVVASDAFFPFADGLEAAAEAGAVAVIQPGGSLNDRDVVAAADRLNLAMLFTGIRHFRH
ncbi:MAG TPA: bifunctional phosphoribosylaminoimidazolecarboxamide formyltransferase/IMP cyclohydrolase [Aestuariivirgaceae bacterium]|nr:bifunctional phosphoribosylaminoimidazolecarboxamide formyltransferase/IMP cyclohydrolase [Aestuariivirgaceae bacterium]